MKYIEQTLCDEVKIITTLSYDEDHHNNDISFNIFDYHTIIKNRKDLCDLLNTDFNHCVAPRQTHSNNLHYVTIKDGGKGIINKESAFENTDALYTKDEELWLWSFHADCCPVMIYANDKHIISSIHSGWKGTVNEICRDVIEYLVKNEGCNPTQLKAFIGPTIEQCHFEAMNDIIDQVKKMSFDTSSFFSKKDDTHYLLDHKGLIKATLLNCGLKQENIVVSPIDTYSDERLFSYRKNKDPYRNITAIKLKGSKI